MLNIITPVNEMSAPVYVTVTLGFKCKCLNLNNVQATFFFENILDYWRFKSEVEVLETRLKNMTLVAYSYGSSIATYSRVMQESSETGPLYPLSKVGSCPPPHRFKWLLPRDYFKSIKWQITL
jgi:hypothetical protein